VQLELKIPPLVVVALVAGAMWAIAAATPAYTALFAGRYAIAGLLAFAGAIIAVLGVVSFRRASTTVNPMKPETTSSLVVGGIYGYTRNPMYLGFLVALLGWGAALGNPLALLPLAAYVAYMNRFQIAPEERALEARFPREFREYRGRVRRWM
jgi:protein-S-isoprenylcysteine O-methyltransferase Ste14